MGTSKHVRFVIWMPAIAGLLGIKHLYSQVNVCVSYTPERVGVTLVIKKNHTGAANLMIL